MRGNTLSWSGEVVDRTWRLGSPVEVSSAGATFETRYGEDARSALITIQETGADTAESARQWSEVLQLSNPHLLKIYVTGSDTLQGVPIVYIITEKPEESLAEILSQRALSADEVREILPPVVDALRYLHHSGYAHTHLSPETVLAAGDQVKLSVVQIARAAEGESGEDMRALGALIYAAFTQRAPAGADLSTLEASGIPQPFSEIVRHCLDPDPAQRWTAEQVAALLRVPEPPEAPVVVPEQPLEPVAAAPPPVRVTYEETEFEPYDEPEVDYGPIPHATVETASRAPRRLSNSMLYGGVALLVVIAGFVGIMRSRRSAPARVVIPPIKTAPFSRPGPVAQSGPAPAQRAPIQRVIPPVNPAIPPPSPASAVAGRNGSGWSVIAATYNSREAAERRAQAMAKRWPKFQPSVSQSGTSRYVVVLGENLSQDQAASLLKRAVSSGLPRDTFISRTQ